MHRLDDILIPSFPQFRQYWDFSVRTDALKTVTMKTKTNYNGGNDDVSDSTHHIPRAIGCGIKVHISLSLGPRRILVGTLKDRL